jgi:hypothetical protein
LKIGFADYNKYLEDLAKTKGVDLAEIKNKLTSCGQPGVGQVKVGFLSLNKKAAHLMNHCNFRLATKRLKQLPG